MSISFAEEVTTAPDMESMPDSAPPVSDIEYPCAVCGKESGPYGGRGRHPTRCPDHKKSTTARTSNAPRVTGTNAVLAAQATEALCSIDGILMLGASLVGFSDTAAVIQDADETFRIRVNAALLNSPDMSRKILKFGSKAGDSALFIAIGLHIATIAPVFMQEAKARKAIKEEAKALAELEANN